MTLYAAPICVVCAHFRGFGQPLPDVVTTLDPTVGERPVTGQCSAFPVVNGIPLEIWESRADHREAFTDDQGIEFLPQDADAADYATLLFRE